MTSVETLLHAIDHCLAQPSSEKLSFNGSVYRGPQLNKVLRNLGTLRPKWDVSVHPLPSGLWELCGRECKKIVKEIVMEDTKKKKKGLPDTMAPIHIATHRI